jgi:NTE family protein
LQLLSDGSDRPYLHLVDGGISDNLGLYAIIEALQKLEASAAFRAAAGLENLRRIAIVVVNANSNPGLGWDKDPLPPPDIALLLQAVSVPIDRYSYETLDALEDLITEWTLRRETQRLGGRPGVSALPAIQFSVVDVSFDDLPDAEERRYLRNLPTRMSLPPEAIDRLRNAAGQLLRSSPVFQKLVRELGAEGGAARSSRRTRRSPTSW